VTREEKLGRIRSRQWYHSIEIEQGLVTPGTRPLAEMRRVLDHLKLPERLDGLTVLDIGAWDGFFSFEAERRGARRVVAYDLVPEDYSGFATAKALLRSRVEYVQGSAYHLDRKTLGTFDVVLFLGVLYHLRYPLLALDRIREICDGFMVLETHHLDDCLLLDDGRTTTLKAIHPRLGRIALYQFYSSNELNSDYSNWFSPNRRAIEDGLRTAGFEPELLSVWGDRVAYRAEVRGGIARYLQQTYEGLRFAEGVDGGMRDASIPVIEDPEESRRRAEERRLGDLEAVPDTDEGTLDARRRVLETDRAARLDQILELSRLLQQSEADRAARLDKIHELTRLWQQSEVDRAARLDQILELTRLWQESEADRAARLDKIHELSRLWQQSEVDRADRLDQILVLSERLRVSEADRATRLQLIQNLQAQMENPLGRRERLAAWFRRRYPWFNRPR
jgi:tRNA (mo5U34)-methyltransferase